MSALVRWTGSALLAERERWSLWFPVGIGAGIACYFSLPHEPSLWLGFAFTGAFSAILAFALRLRFGSVGGLAPGCAMILLTASLGFTAAQLRTYGIDTRILEKPHGPAVLEGRVEVVETFPKGMRLTLVAPRVSGLSAPETPGGIRVRVRSSGPAILPGDWVRVRARLSPPPEPVQPGAFDFQRQSYFSGLGAVGFGFGDIEILKRGDDGTFLSPATAVGRLRAVITGRILAALDPPAAGVAAALITGEKRAISEEHLTRFRDSGLAHLLAISGLHIGLVAGILFVGFRLVLSLFQSVALRYPIKKWAALGAILGAFCYALIAGATLPTQRAFIMIALALVAVVFDRRGLSLRSVAWAATIILVFRPESLLSAGFQMSFAAVLGLVAAYEEISKRREAGIAGGKRTPGWLGMPLRYAGGVALSSLIAGAATAPFAVYHFNRFAEFGLLANLMAVPVTALWIMPWAVAALVLMPFGLEAGALIPMAWGIDLVLDVAGWISTLPGAVVHLPSAPIWGLALVTAGGLWLCLWRQRWRFAGFAVVLAGCASVSTVVPPDVLIDGAGKLLAVRNSDGSLRFSSRRQARYTRESWLRLAGQPDTTDRPLDLFDGGPIAGFACDSLGCILRRNGRTVALARQPGAVLEDCWRADAVVSPEPIRTRCPAPTVVDRFDLWRRGAHAIWLMGDGVRTVNTVDTRGDRPWVPRRDR